MNHYKLILTFVLFATSFTSCQEIFERDLQKESITLLAPPNNNITTSFKQTFWWEEVSGASHYNLQIVSPTFNNIQNLIVDTIVNSNKYTTTLQPGSYQWRLRAENASSFTEYSTWTLTIDSTTDLTQHIIVLSAPDDNHVTNNMTVTFKWDSIYSAEDYRLQIATPNFNSAGNIFYDVTINNASLTYTFITAGDFEWQVRAQNATSNSGYTKRSLTIDISSPNAPTQLAPANNSTVSSPGTLAWTVDPTSVMDTLYIYDDSLITPPINIVSTTDTFYIYSGSSGEDHFWRVRSVDAAGNISAYSTLFKFTFQ
ncbi:MAG: hypothetical protein IIA45_04290 [Bacteroidetes bacterium]|nr:hypothetical protein [Bacteroidota bacterium]